MADKSAITFENISNDVIEKWQGIADLLASIISVPAFVASGYAEDPVMLDPAAYGFNGALAKPFMKAQLVEMLNRYQTTIRQRD